MIVGTLAMVGQGFDHAAVAHPAVAALVHHALQLGAEGHQLRDPSFHLGHVSAGDAVRLGDLIAPLFALGALRRGHEASAPS